MKFSCPQCNNPIDATGDQLGQLIDCTHCGNTVEVPIRQGAMPSAGGRMKSCPLCGESIMAIAVKCKHCGSMLNGSGNVQKVTVAGIDPFAHLHTPIQGKTKGKLTVIGILGMLFGLLVIIASINGCIMMSNPDGGEGFMYMFLIGLGFMVASFLWARK